MLIDIFRLREDLKNYYGTAMFNGFQMAIMELRTIERATDEELLQLSEKVGIDINKYQIL